MKKFLPVVCCFCLLLITTICAAQEHKSPETLPYPAAAYSDAGFFKNLNALPESVRRSKPFARILHEYERRASVEGSIDAEARLAAYEQSKADLLRDATTALKSSGSKLPVFADAWQNIGPSTSTTSAGCTKALAVHPTNSSIVYAGAAEGGVWKTTNATATTPTWTALTDLVIPDLAVASIAITPSDPNIVYVGSGDPSVAIDGLVGTGLYKTTDAGGTWSRIATNTFTKTVNKVLVHPTNSDVVFACNYSSNRGLYRSTNGGTTFTKVFPTTGFANGVIWDIVSAQTIAGKLIMYMVEGNNPGDNSSQCGVYKSLDDGASWIKISTANLPSGDQFGKAALAIPKGNLSVVYCFIAQPDGNLKGLYRSVNAGILFNALTVPTTIFRPNTDFQPQGWYDLYLGVTMGNGPASNDTVYIGGVEAYRSYNGGSTWQVYSSYQLNNGVHVDHQSIAIDPGNSRRIWIGTDGGVYRSPDAGANWSYKSSGMNTMRAYRIGLDKNDFKKTYTGFQDQGIWRTTAGQGPNFLGFGDGFQTLVDPSNSNVIYGEGANGDLAKSTTNGTNFFDINDPTFEISQGWDVPFKLAPHNSQTLFTARRKLWKTTNGGNNWSSVSNTFYNSSDIVSLGLSPASSSTYWLGFNGGKIQLTTDGGTNWAEKSTNVPRWVSVRSIVCHPYNPDFALIGLSAGTKDTARVMLTTDRGATWTNVSGTNDRILPGVPVNCVAIDSVNPASVWYAATINGIYYTLDGGQNWSIAGSGIGLAPCNDVQIHPNKVTIRVGTHGRSVWEANTNILPVELTGLTATKTSKGTELHWKTDSEFNSSGFWVQRSFNYQPFEDIGFVSGAGNSNTEINYSFLDNKSDEGYYIFRLKQVDLDGSEHLSNTVDMSYGSASALRLDQNFPNPFTVSASSTTTHIRFFLPENEIVTLRLYSSDGVVIRTFINKELRAAGEQVVDWDGTDATGVPVSSGGYFYTLETEQFGTVSKLLIFQGK